MKSDSYFSYVKIIFLCICIVLIISSRDAHSNENCLKFIKSEVIKQNNSALESLRNSSDKTLVTNYFNGELTKKTWRTTAIVILERFEPQIDNKFLGIALGHIKILSKFLREMIRDFNRLDDFNSERWEKYRKGTEIKRLEDNLPIEEVYSYLFNRALIVSRLISEIESPTINSSSKFNQEVSTQNQNNTQPTRQSVPSGKTNQARQIRTRELKVISPNSNAKKSGAFLALDEFNVSEIIEGYKTIEWRYGKPKDPNLTHIFIWDTTNQRVTGAVEIKRVVDGGFLEVVQTLLGKDATIEDGPIMFEFPGGGQVSGTGIELGRVYEFDSPITKEQASALDPKFRMNLGYMRFPAVERLALKKLSESDVAE